MKKEERLLPVEKIRSKHTSLAVDVPDEGGLALYETLDELRRLLRVESVEYADELREDPLRHLQDAQSVHMVRVHVAPDVAHVPVVSDLVERDEHPRDLDPERARERGFTF